MKQSGIQLQFALKKVIHVERLSLWLVHKIPFRCYTLVKRGEVYYFDSRKDELHEAAAGI